MSFPNPSTCHEKLIINNSIAILKGELYPNCNKLILVPAAGTDTEIPIPVRTHTH